MKLIEGPSELMLAEVHGPGALMEAARGLRAAGYSRFDCHSPFPIHGMDEAMGLKRSPLGWLAGAAAIGGCAMALGLQWWTMSEDYPLVISGKPFFAFQAYVPVTFALGVMGAAFAGLFGMLILNKLPRYNHPIFHSERFARVTDDAFFVSVEVTDPNYDRAATRTLLEQLGGRDIEVLTDA